VNGKLVEEKIIAQLASISKGDVDKLMDMYATLNFCSNSTSTSQFAFNNLKQLKFSSLGGMDACDKVSKLLECGKTNSPEAIVGLMNNLENAITVFIFINILFKN